ARKLRSCRSRNPLISTSLLGPSTPQFQERLSELPSRFSSPFASLCFSLYVTRSFSVYPSCAVMKLTHADGFRPRRSNRSGDATKRVERAAGFAWPLQKSRTVSRYLSFHSPQPGGNSPT